MDIEKNIKRMYKYKTGAGDCTQFMDSCDVAIEALLELQKAIKENCNLQRVSVPKGTVCDICGDKPNSIIPCPKCGRLG